MKILKKIAAIAISASLAAAMISSASYAEGTAFKLYAESESASIGETASVSVVIDVTGTSVAAIDFTLVYDTDELEFVEDSFTEGEKLGDWIGDKDSKPGEFGFHYAAMDEEKDALSEKNVFLMSISFKVLKPNAQIAFGAVEICAADFDGTDITDSGTVEETVIVKCSHKNAEETVIQPTCKDEGKRETICKDCGEIVKSETLPKTNNHTWGEGNVTKEPSCTEKGTLTYTCAVCGSTKTEDTEALGHAWDNGTVTKDPTCTENGTKTIACTRCSETKTEEIPALGHDWGEWTATKEATSDEDGEEARECKICGEKETRAVGKLPAESTTAVYTGGSFQVPETAAATSAESEATAAAPTTSAPVNDQAPDETATAAAPVPADNAPVSSDGDSGNTDTYDTAAVENNNIGNADGGNSDNQNLPTGIALTVIPAVAAAVGAMIFKKRK